MLRVLLIIGLFFAGGLADVCWAQYTVAVSNYRENVASAWSMGIFVVGAIGVTAYVQDPYLLIPVALGGAVFTKLSVRHSRLRLEKAES